MADNRSKKIQINAEVLASFDTSLKQAKKFREELSKMSLPKTLTKDLEKQFSDYQKNLLKLINFKPTTGNISEYQRLVKNLSSSFEDVETSVKNLSKNTSTYFKDTSSLTKYKKQIEELQKSIQAADKAGLSYFGVSSDTSSEARKAAYRKKAQEMEGKNLSGAAAIASQQKQVDTKTTLEEAAKAREKVILLENQLAAAEANRAKEEKDANAAVEQANSSFKKITPSIEEANTSLKEYVQEQARIKAENSANQLSQQIASWTALSAAFIYAKNQLTQMKNTYLDLDASLTQIAVVSGRTRQEMWNMIGTYNEMAQRLGATTSDVVESSKLYFQQGRSQSEVMKLVEQTAILASISELDFADATNYLTAAINGFKLEASDATNVTDIWANLAAKAAVDTDELALAISKVASIAKSAGMDIESTSAFLTKMINFAIYTRIA